VHLDEMFGLDELGMAVYRAAAAHRQSDVETLAEWVDQPVDLVRAEVKRQLDAGLLRRVGDMWEAQDPLLVLQARHAARESALAARRLAMLEERAALYRSRLFSDYLAGRRRAGTHDGIVAVLDHHQIWARIAELVENSHDQVLFLLGGASYQSGAQVEVMGGMVRAARRGVRIASVWTPEQVATVRAMGRSGRLPPIGWVRQSAFVPMRTVVVDATTAVFPLDPDDLARGGLVVEAPGLRSLITDMIERVHRDAQPLTVPRPASRTDDPAEQRRYDALLALLAQGLTDQTIAARLGVTVRTVRRDVADLYDRLGVSSRFQLGAAAARLGMLPALEM
jgi:DNA-binding CsgD family transcriptional regulator